MRMSVDPAGMRDTKAFACAVLLFSFVLGTVPGLALREKLADWQRLFFPSDYACIAAVLALDAAMTCSPLAWLALPAVTLLFGAVSTQELFMIRQGTDAWKRLLLLMTAAPLHFTLSCWSLRVASRICYGLRNREKTGRLLLSALWMSVFALIGCVLTLAAAHNAHL